MFKFLRKRKMKGQSTLEYAVLIIIIIGALLSIQVYIKRGLQGRLKSATDDIGDQFSVGNTNWSRNTQVNSITNETFLQGVTRSQLIEQDEVTSIFTNSQVVNTEQEFWGKQ